MSRIPIKYIDTPFIHIMIQGINKEYIFNNKTDIEKYLKILKQTKEEINVTIIAYCVMNNHVHLLFYVENMENLVKFMHNTNLKYAKYYNKKYNRVGYLLRDRYKKQPINSERHLLCCINYIHNNPVKAKLCKKPSDYKYSSYNNNMFQGDIKIEKNIRNYVDLGKINNINYEDKDFVLMEETEENKEQLCKDIIKDYLIKENINLDQIINNNNLLINLVRYLKEEYKISYRLSGKILGIKREKLRILMKWNNVQ